MRPKFRLFLIVTIALLLAACEPGIIDIATNTPGVNDPTPTQEVVLPTPTHPAWPTNTPIPTNQPNYDMSCVEGNEAPLNKNPCLSPLNGTGNIPDWEWVVEPNGNYKNSAGDNYLTEVLYDNGYLFPLAGVAGEGFAGFIGIDLHGLALIGGQCYGGFFPGDLNVNDMPPSQFTDVSFQAFIMDDEGHKHPLNIHGITYVGVDGIRRVDETATPFWTWWMREDETVIMRMGINQNHANARMGNAFRPHAAYVVPIDAINCPGAGI